MEVKEVTINVDQNVQVYDDNRFLTLRLGVGLKADVPAQSDLAQAARDLRAQARMKSVVESIREEKDLM